MGSYPAGLVAKLLLTLSIEVGIQNCCAIGYFQSAEQATDYRIHSSRI